MCIYIYIYTYIYIHIGIYISRPRRRAAEEVGHAPRPAAEPSPCLRVGVLC